MRRGLGCGQNQWYHFGVGVPSIFVNFSGDWDVHWGYGILTRGRLNRRWLAFMVFPGHPPDGMTGVVP